VKITDAIQEFILYKQSLGMSYKNRALKLNAFAHCAGPIEIDNVDPETVRRFLDGDRPVTTDWFNKFSVLKMFYRFAHCRAATQHTTRFRLAKRQGDFGLACELWKHALGNSTARL